MKNPLIDALEGHTHKVPPVWLMRQAGRYLPEYREIRGRVATFLDLCLTPALAAEVTLQPVKRFQFDAAILFSDILIVPYALGRRLSFESGEGPQLDPLADAAALADIAIEVDETRLAPVYETIERVRSELAPEVALLGFCGAPWTVATYMIAGRGTDDQRPARLFAYRDPEAFARLITILEQASIDYLVGQFRAGVDAVQIFDSWAGILPADEFDRWCVRPVARIVAEVIRQVPSAKVIGFPRGAGISLLRFVENVPVDGLALDWMVDRAFAKEWIQPRVTVQGNLDPLALLAGGPALDQAVDAILDAFAGGPFIFNLGHGILPETPISHVERMIARVRGGPG